ncbi:aldo/keto reductase [Rhodobacterales bacterium 52_120_T64]|nr:aldo/keto reductase [Rhodobacterales bacterium 52_120_T64]
MQYKKLGRTDIEVSALCLGSMTWGTQNSEAEGHGQIDIALNHGVNLIDTAEMYPVTPINHETQGRTEEIIGSWFANTGRRDDVIIATKVIGGGSSAIKDREGADISPATIREAVEGSLKRLQTDYIDLYQFHWPNRGSYHFRKYWAFDPSGQDRNKTRDDMAECLRTLGELVNEGKIRHFGTSNESCWGVSQFLDIAEAEGLPRMASIQNEYSLLCRIYDLDLAELSINEDVGLLAYSPLAAGILTGKYQGDVTPAGSRRTFSENLGGRLTKNVFPAVDGYLAVSNKHGLDPSQMALAFCISRPFMASVIFGATTNQQLENSLKAVNLSLSDDVMADIQSVRREHPMPI